MPPACVTSLTWPSPKLNETLLMVPVLAVPFAVKVSEYGALPVFDLSRVKLVHTGGVPLPLITGVLVGVGAEEITAVVGVGAPEGTAVGIAVGVGAVVVVGTGVVDTDAAPTAIVAGVAVDKTFSLA